MGGREERYGRFCLSLQNRNQFLVRDSFIVTMILSGILSVLHGHSSVKNIFEILLHF